MLFVLSTLDNDIKLLCEQYGVELRVLPSDLLGNLKLLMYLRFDIYAKVCEPYTGYCLATDFRDVYFQSNPFHGLASLENIDLILSVE